MPFNPPESATYINIKLTDAGRRSLSLGQLQFAKAVISDREIDYSIDRSESYDILSNRILAPVDDYPNIDPVNFDGTNAIQLTNKEIVSFKQFNTAQTATAGLFSGSSNSWAVLSSSTYYCLGTRTLTYAANAANFGTSTIQFAAGPYTPTVNNLVYIAWGGSSSVTVTSGTPFNGLWYKIISAATANIFTLDRPIPNLGGARTVGAFFYPDNAVENYYGSGATQQTKFWNMNITRPYDVAGTQAIEGVSGYSTYGSIEFAGTKTYLGFDEAYPAIGIVHYTNKFSGQTYGEQLIEKSVIINMPTVMWHNYAANNGEGLAYGLTLYDTYGDTTYDYAAKTTYRELRDGIQSTNKVVGRVYHKLQIFVITDQDLIQVLSYKGNRNYTFPEPILNLVSNPKSPLTTNDVTGLCNSGYTYYVSYLVESDPYDATDSFGYTNPIHCGYLKQIDGEVDIDGNPQYLSVQFPPNSFPYMRNDTTISTSGSGWNAQRIKFLVNEQLKSDGYKVGNVPASSWVVMSGQGIFDCTVTPSTPTATIDPVTLNSYQFIMSREDYTSGATDGYYQMWTGHTGNGDYLSFGGESFFYGTVDAQVFNTTYKTVISVIAPNFLFNESQNDTFNSLTDENTYITEIAVLDNQNNTVAIGKPTYPLKKSNARYVAFQLQIDF